MPRPAPPASTATAGPVLKWAGGKRSLLGPILRLLPATMGTYFEPFVGSGAVFFAVAAEGRAQRVVLGDQNAELLDVYRALRRSPGAVSAALAELARQHSEARFYEVRGWERAELALPLRAARTIYLNKTCFNGLYRVNSEGLFNVPFGRRQRAGVPSPAQLAAAGAALRGVKLTRADFERTCAAARRGDVVYLDPPYVPLSSTAYFTAYQAEGFRWADHERLERLLGALHRRGVRAVLSNADVPATRELYARWRLHEVSVRRSVGASAESRGHARELLVVNEPR